MDAKKIKNKNKINIRLLKKSETRFLRNLSP